MEKYNYQEEILKDVISYIEDHYTEAEIKENLLDSDDFAEELNDQMWIADSVTGNASGSYTCNAWKAEEYICHNLDLLGEAVAEFGGSTDVLKDGAESCDVTIRCYLLGGAIADAISYYENKFNN